jgi:hypothetical protein
MRVDMTHLACTINGVDALRTSGADYAHSAISMRSDHVVHHILGYRHRGRYRCAIYRAG